MFYLWKTFLSGKCVIPCRLNCKKMGWGSHVSYFASNRIPASLKAHLSPAFSSFLLETYTFDLFHYRIDWKLAWSRRCLGFAKLTCISEFQRCGNDRSRECAGDVAPAVHSMWSSRSGQVRISTQSEPSCHWSSSFVDRKRCFCSMRSTYHCFRHSMHDLPL